jgi:C-terminal processing protease CtpA/Prc
MIKPVLFLSITLIFSCRTSTNKFNEELIKIVKENSIYSDSMDWAAVERKMAARNPKNLAEAALYMIELLHSSGDNHSRYVKKQGLDMMMRETDLYNQPASRYFGDHIGYISVPGFLSFNESQSLKFATRIQELIRSLDSHDIRGWVVDLRHNAGGNMYPMIAGLGPLTGEGTLGYFLETRGRMTPWAYRDGCCSSDIDTGQCYIKVADPYEVKVKDAKIAVLISGNTGSSGEMTAISVIGNKNSMIFGLPSAGALSGNRTFILSDSSCLALASCYTMDRNKKLYEWRIVPDIYIDTSYEKCINAALLWLKKNK